MTPSLADVLGFASQLLVFLTRLLGQAVWKRGRTRRARHNARQALQEALWGPPWRLLEVAPGILGIH